MRNFTSLSWVPVPRFQVPLRLQSLGTQLSAQMPFSDIAFTRRRVYTSKMSFHSLFNSVFNFRSGEELQ